MGTVWRKHDPSMRQESTSPSGFAQLDSAFSRRSTVMSALPWETGVIHAYQSDSSSKQPAPSILIDTRETPRIRDGPIQKNKGWNFSLDNARSISEGGEAEFGCGFAASG